MAAGYSPVANRYAAVRRPSAPPRGPAAGPTGPAAAGCPSRAAGRAPGGTPAALPPSRYGSRSSYVARVPAAAASRAIHGSSTGNGTTLRRSTFMVASASRSGSPVANSRSTGQQDPVGDHVEDHGELGLRQVRRAGQRAERVGAVRDRVRPALAGHEAAQVALAQQPGGQPVAPLEDLAAGQQRPLVVAGDALGEHQRGEAAAEHRVGALLAEPDLQSGRPCRRRGRPAGRRTRLGPTQVASVG